MQNRTFFVTSVTWQRHSIFQNDVLAREFLSTIYDYRAAGKLELHEFVIMPDHVHLMLTPAAGLTLERVMQLIKGGFSHRVGKGRPNLMIWEKSSTNHRIRDERDYGQHREYIHQNPIRKFLVQSAEKFPYSSACSGFVLDPPPFAVAAPEGASLAHPWSRA